MKKLVAKIVKALTIAGLMLGIAFCEVLMAIADAFRKNKE